MIYKTKAEARVIRMEGVVFQNRIRQINAIT